eukprot:9078634-Alexandrium_andersonii.AAC.1
MGLARPALAWRTHSSVSRLVAGSWRPGSPSPRTTWRRRSRGSGTISTCWSALRPTGASHVTFGNSWTTVAPD